jgi:hypothetical protein
MPQAKAPLPVAVAEPPVHVTCPIAAPEASIAASVAPSASLRKALHGVRRGREMREAPDEAGSGLSPERKIRRAGGGGELSGRNSARDARDSAENHRAVSRCVKPIRRFSFHFASLPFLEVKNVIISLFKHFLSKISVIFRATA